jgi:hypothetical protein
VKSARQSRNKAFKTYAFVLALFCAPATTFSQGLPLQPSHKEIISVQLGPYRLNIDRRYLAWGRTDCPDELCDFWALLPEVAPVNKDNWQSFNYSGPDSKKLLIFLQHTPLTRLRTREALWEDYKNIGWIDPHGTTADYDLTYHRALTPALKGKDVYTGKSAASLFLLLVCDRASTVPSPLCEVRYPLEPDLTLTYVFRTAYLADWRNIDSKVSRLVASFRE